MPVLNKRAADRGVSPRLLYVVAAMAAFVGLVALVRGGRTSEIDRRVTFALQRRKSPWFARLMQIVSWPGFPPQSRILPLAIPAVIAVAGFPLEAVFQLLGWGTSAISGLTKLIMRRPRPNHPEITVAVARIGGTSFPSGHVINYVGVYGFLAFLANRYVRPPALKRVIVGSLATLIALVGPSRIYLGHHWFSDVLASYILGSSYLIVLTSIYRRVKAWTGWR
jgi:undecaprenyl-diphosphatase